MTHQIKFDPSKHFPPEQVIKIPVIAMQRGFKNADEMLADLVKRDLFPEQFTVAAKPAAKTAKKSRKQKGKA